MPYYVVANAERVEKVLVADQANLPAIVASLKSIKNLAWSEDYSFYTDGTPGVDAPMEGYVKSADGWIPPPPFPSWKWNEKTKAYDPPVARPKVDKAYTSWVWDEAAGKWSESGKGIPKDLDPSLVPEVGS